MTKQELKQLSNNTFIDNNQGLITPAGHRAFNNALIDEIAETIGTEQYSLIETATNKKWIDGRTIYRICFYAETMGGVIGHMPSYDLILSVNGTYMNWWGAQPVNSGHLDHSGYGVLVTIQGSNVVFDYFHSNGNSDNYPIVVIIEYVKPSEVEPPLYTTPIYVDAQLCINCGSCVCVCPVEAIRPPDGEHQTYWIEQHCINCAACEPDINNLCPVGAIKTNPNVI